MTQRKIIHIDMDCYFAAVEMRDNPKYRNIPLAIGGTGRRAVLSTANYEARKYGVGSAMPTALALKKCPQLTVIHGNYQKYTQISKEIREIFYEYTDLVEPLSIDEAFLDVTDCKKCKGSATLIAREIKEKILKKTKLTASAGVAPNKFLAKVASDWKKPNGLFVITPDDVENFIQDLPVSKIFGVGKVTTNKLKSLGMHTCKDIQEKDIDFLYHHFGSFAETLYENAHGIDHRPLCSDSAQKSISIEETYEYDLPSLEHVISRLHVMYGELEHRYKKWFKKEKDHLTITKAFIKIRFSDFKTTTVEKARPNHFFKEFNQTFIIQNELSDLFETLLTLGYERYNKPVRLIGLGFKLQDQDSEDADNQLELPF